MLPMISPRDKKSIQYPKHLKTHKNQEPVTMLKPAIFQNNDSRQQKRMQSPPLLVNNKTEMGLIKKLTNNCYQDQKRTVHSNYKSEQKVKLKRIDHFIPVEDDPKPDSALKVFNFAQLYGHQQNNSKPLIYTNMGKNTTASKNEGRIAVRSYKKSFVSGVGFQGHLDSRTIIQYNPQKNLTNPFSVQPVEETFDILENQKSLRLKLFDHKNRSSN